MDVSIQGERFGKLVVIGSSSEIKNACHTVLCKDHPGNEAEHFHYPLV